MGWLDPETNAQRGCIVKTVAGSRDRAVPHQSVQQTLCHQVTFRKASIASVAQNCR